MNESTKTLVMLACMVIGIYILFLSIRGNDKITDNFPDVIKERATKTARLFYLVLGLALLVFSILEFVLPGTAVYTIAIGVPAIIIGYMIIFYIKYGKEIKESKDRF